MGGKDALFEAISKNAFKSNGRDREKYFVEDIEKLIHTVVEKFGDTSREGILKNVQEYKGQTPRGNEKSVTDFWQIISKRVSGTEAEKIARELEQSTRSLIGCLGGMSHRLIRKM